MAKQRATIDAGLFKSTEEGAPAVEVPAEGPIKSITVGLRRSEIELVEAIAQEHEIARNALLRYAVRHFLTEYAAGRVDLAASIEAPPPPKKRLIMP